MSVTELDRLPAEEVCPNLFCQFTPTLPLSLPTLLLWLIGATPLPSRKLQCLSPVFYSPIALEAVSPFLSLSAVLPPFTIT